MPGYVIGPLLIVAGALLFVHRQRFADFTIRRQREMYGERAGEFFEARNGGLWIGVVAFGAIAMGVLFLSISILGTVQQAGA